MNPKAPVQAMQMQSFDINSLIAIVNQIIGVIAAVVPKLMGIAFFCVVVLILARLAGRNWLARIDNTLLIGAGIVFALAARGA